jgi:hypothetical protein
LSFSLSLKLSNSSIKGKRSYKLLFFN